ncbi:hypothetical protein, partial [Klebsiella pneumoniae]
ITPSVAEQEGQQTETEATGAPQKHHYTLNQQVGSITNAMKNLKIAYVDEKLVAIECDGLSCSSLPVSEFPIDSAALTLLPQLMLEDVYAATS